MSLKAVQYNVRPWWMVPLHGSPQGRSSWTTVMLLMVLMLLMPQGLWAQTDYKSWYPFKENVTFNANNGDPYITWTTVVFNDEGLDEGFFEGDTYAWGLGVHMKAANDNYKYAGNLCCNENGYNRRMYNIYSKKSYSSDTEWTTNDSWDYGGQFKFGYGQGTDGNGKITWIKPYWKIPFDLRNTNITVRLWGTWYYWQNKGTRTEMDVTQTIACPYTFTIRKIEFNGGYRVDPDGTVHVPYRFEGTGNTDGHTTICTAINGSWSGKIGYRYPSSDYSDGEYTFKLNDIGRNMRSDFNIETYHEYKHAFDRDADGGTKYYTTSAGTMRFAAMPVANITSGKFNQSDGSVTLYWTANNSNFQQGNWGTKWIIYRDGVKVGTVMQNEANNANYLGNRNYYFVDTQNIQPEKDYKYTIYYVWSGWDESAQVSELKSNEVTVNTMRSVPINDVNAESETDRIVFTWTSSSYEANWCTFKVFIDNETEPVYTVSPEEGQTSFRWEHRYADIDGREKGTETEGNSLSGYTTYGYAKERLDGCAPHNYRIEGYVGGKKQNEVTLSNKAIGSKTRFVSFKATKGVYAGTVKLSWQIKFDEDNMDKVKTYIVGRRTAEREDEAWTTLYRTSGKDEYMFYTDETALPGIYYDYQVMVQEKCDNGNIVSCEATDVGFAQATGTVSGRITYGTTGMAVQDADVVAEMTGSSGEELEQFHAMYFDSTDGLLKWSYPSKTYLNEKFSSGNYTVQLWIKPEELKSGQAIVSFKNGQALYAKTDGSLLYGSRTNNVNLGITLKKGIYSHLVLARSGNELTCYLVEPVVDGNPTVTKTTNTVAEFGETQTMVQISKFEVGQFKGYIDEFRVWTKCLTEDEILENYDRLLVGNEKGLETYWTFDEGLTKQFFDYSREGTTYHEHHGKVMNNAKPTTDTPQALSLKAKTDKDGNYIIMGVPFSGEGTTYAIKPSLGVHSFNPQQHLRYVGNNSLVHNGVDFDDVSSFKVTGTVLYENTTIPVKDAYLYIDGVMASRDGEPVKTNSEGKYEISVPIGDHFVQVKMQGHTFLNGGRYPNDPDSLGLRHTFENEVVNLDFFDQTLVTVAGRVAGGDIEYEKPLGLGQGVNNIGKAVLQLSIDSNKQYLNVAPQDPDAETTTTSINTVDRVFQTAYGTAKVPGGENYIEVETDATTGEWVAQLPPLRYSVTYVSIPSRPASDIINTQSFSLPIIDATNPSVTYTDSTEVDGVWEKFDYVASAKMRYKSPSTIEVTENNDGSFGIKNYKVTDISGKEHDVPLYTIDNDGKVKYAFGVTDQNPDGYPVYLELSSYKYNLYAYENYKNYDGDVNNPVAVKVPLAGKTVTIKNQFASTTSVRQDNGEYVEILDNKLELDDDGKAVYKFTVGFPNIQSPYTRGMSISYDNNGTEMPWDGNGKFQVIVIGGLPTGNNFVTEGPDEVLMVLRDPPGTGSKTTWNKGTTVSRTTTTTTEYNNKTGINSTFYLGVETSTAAGFGVMVITDLKSKFNIKAGAEYNAQRTSGNTKVSKTTTTQEISTKDNIDFVGACGDIFIGTSKNLIFGASRAVDIKWNNVSNKPELVQEDAMTTGEQFTTSFAYDQNNVKNVLIPNFENLRNALLTPGDPSLAARPAKGSKEPLYVTSLSKDDPKYGTSNDDKSVWGNDAVPFSTLANGIYRGPSYTMLLPIDYETDPDLKGIQDMVKYYNTQINKWQNELAKNEEAKVKAMSDRKKYLKENHSFSAGASVTQTLETEQGETIKSSQSDGFNIVLGLETGFRFSGVGIGLEVTEENGGTWTEEDENETTTTASMSYQLVEDGDDDYISVDVYNAPDGFGPIFVTRGGATSCPYEDEVVTEYYQPGTVISKKTVQIEKPEIEVQNPIITGIPAGGQGTFKVNIRNNSDTGEDLWFNLYVPPYSNPDGLAVKMDDASLNKGVTVLVKAGETLEKTINISQTDPDVLDYENVQIKLSSQCQKDNTSTYDEISSTAEFTAHFQPSCSDIILETSHTIVNTSTKDMLTLSMSGYNYSMASLQGIRLQYKGENDADFRTLKEWMKTPGQNQEQLTPLVGTEKLTYTFDLCADDYDDKTYVFRAVTVCDQGGVEVNNESNELNVIRDMSCPQLIATPSPASGILNSGSDLLVTFNEDIQNSILTNSINFDVVGELNEREVAHDVALSLTGNSAAKTDATINLSGKSFSASMWVNYQTDGTLLMHGTKDNNFTVAIKNGKLAVSVAGQEATSENVVLPKNKWLYLNVSYEADETTPIVNAAYAEGTDKVTLLNGVQTKVYDGNGVISLGGNGLTAKVQELSVWNSGRSIDEATADMYTTKSQYTNGLLGYWQFDEGHGTVATDKARLRHITLPSQNAWWINGDNFALPLDGAKTAAVNIGNLNTTSSEDYLVETWFKADEQQDGVASVMSTGKMDLRLNAQGQMEVLLGNVGSETANNTTLVYNKNLRDGQWHHLAVSVLKSTNGSGNIYIDGQQYKQISASVMPELFGDKLMLGGRRLQPSQGVYTFAEQLKGAIDEVRIWKGRRTANVIKDNMYARVKANEAGLVAYYPLEKNTRDAYNQVVAVGTLANSVTSGSSAEELSFFAADGTELSTLSSEILNSENTAALKQAPKKENVQFNFVASERQIKVNITEAPARIEGCNIYITIKEVKDLHGNKADAITWGVYVQQNNLRWEESEVELVKNVAEKATFTATIENRGSESETWSLSGLPTWLTVNTEGGTLKPLTSGTLTFTVAESLPTGKYEQTIYLTGSQNISEPMTINVKVKGEEPDWAVNAGAYQETMNVIGGVQILGVPSQDEDDILAAFIDNECRGVARPVYEQNYDGYFVTMDIYGSSADNGKPMEFKIFDASTGIIYPVVKTYMYGETTATDFTYQSNTLEGRYATPMTFDATDEIEQNIELVEGWNWMSFNVEPDQMTVPVYFANADGRVKMVRAQQNYKQYENGNWFGRLNSISTSQMYLVQTNEAFTLSVTGHPVVTANAPVTVKNGWTWAGFNAQSILSVPEALASMNPEKGDIIKGQIGVAYYENNMWYGSLKMLVPGKGYMIQATNERSFSYPATAVAGARMAPQAYDESVMPKVFRPVDYTSYPSNMVLIAKVVKNGMPMPYAELGIFSGDQCREAVVTDGQGMVYITIPGDAAAELTFRVVEDDNIFFAAEKVNYETDAVVGSPNVPFLIDLGNATGIENVNAISNVNDMYDLLGRKVQVDGQNSKLRKGVYIVNGKKQVK